VIPYARVAALRSIRTLRGRGALACALVLPLAVTALVHAPPPFGESGDPAALRLAAGWTAGLTCCVAVGLLAVFLVGDEAERGRLRSLRAAGLDVPAMIAAQVLFVAVAAGALSVIALLGPCVACLGSVAPKSWCSNAVGSFAASVLTGVFGLGLPLLVPRWTALTATTIIAVLVSMSGAGVEEFMRDEPTSVIVSWVVGACALLVFGALRTSRRLGQGKA